jgi:multidrug efflux pump subunit AcrA (membrane-fusion protein)
MFAAIGLAIKGVEKLSDSSTKAKDNLSNLFSSMGVSGFTDSLNLYGSPASNAAARVAKDQKAAAAAQLKATKAQTKAAQDQAKLKKANTLFDIEQIQIMAALQGKLSADEKLRLSLQLALLQGNASEADRLGKQLAISQLQTTNLAIAIANIPMALNPFKGWGSEIDNLLAKMIEMYRMLQMKPNLPQGIIKAEVTPQNAASVLANAPVSLSEYQSITSVMSDVGVKTPTLNITINNAGNVVSDGDLVNQIRNGLLNQNLSGSPSAVGRLLGAFQ